MSQALNIPTSVSAHPGHNRQEEEEQAPPVSFHVLLRKFNAYGKDTDCQNYACNFKGDSVHVFGVYQTRVRMRPLTRVEYIYTLWADNDTKEESPTCFTNVELE